MIEPLTALGITMDPTLEEVINRISWLQWEEKLALLQVIGSYVGEDTVEDYLRGIERARSSRLQILEGRIVSFLHREHPVSFFVQNIRDEIQKHHARGTFYEKEELSLMAEFFTAGGVILDIGANVGNHAVYAGLFLNPSKIIAIESNPAAFSLLKHNVSLNDLRRVVDFSFLGIGLSDRPGRACFVSAPENNLGGARLSLEDPEGECRIERGDDLLEAQRVDFIKLDVEGMELEVLSGLTNIIRDQAPVLHVEVRDANVPRFVAFVQEHGYSVARETRPSNSYSNFIAVR